MKKTIWLNPPLKRLQNQLTDASQPRRYGQFSRRLGDIVERYEAILRLTPLPSITAVEREILTAALTGVDVTLLVLQHLDEQITQCTAVDQAACKHLAKRVRAWSPAERVAIIEDLGL